MVARNPTHRLRSGSERWPCTCVARRTARLRFGEVVDKQDLSPFSMPTVRIKVKQTTQDGDTILTGVAEVELPR